MRTWSLNSFIRTPMLLMAAIETFILFTSVYVGAILIFGSLEASELTIGPLAPKALIVSFVVFVSLIAMGLYQFRQRFYFREAVTRVIAGLAAGCLGLLVVFYIVPTLRLSAPAAGVSVLYATVLLVIARYYFVRTVDENVFRRRTLIYGAGKRAKSISDLRRRADRRGFKIVGKVAAPGDADTNDENALRTNGKNVSDFAWDFDADEIVVAMDDRRGNLPVRDLLDAKLRGVAVIDLLEFLERETGKIRIDLVNPGWLIFQPGFRKSWMKRANKRGVDLLASALLLLVSWPVMLVIALAIKLEDGWRADVFYRQVRVGRYNKPFPMMKFRSMRSDAEADGKAVWALENDNRITRVGACLRKFRLDELPQIFNILRGQMSLVGPRPERPEFVENLRESVPYYSERHTVKPGLTGWAQLNYSYGASEEDTVEKLQYDLYYVKNQGLMLDNMILLQTVEVVLWGKGAR